MLRLAPTQFTLIDEFGNYTWAANGIKAKQNNKENIVAKFESVLEGTLRKRIAWRSRRVATLTSVTPSQDSARIYDFFA